MTSPATGSGAADARRSRVPRRVRQVRIPTAPIVAAGLLGGYLVARETEIRPLGGAVLAAAGVTAGRQWLRTSGPVATGALAAVYLGGFGASHPLAKRIGAWPAVGAAAALSAGSSWIVSDRRATR